MLLEWSGLVLACARVIQTALETQVASKLHEQVKVSPFGNLAFLSACCQSRRKANIKAPLALLVLIIIYCRVVARVPVMHEAVPDSHSLQVKHSCLYVPSFTRKIANFQQLTGIWLPGRSSRKEPGEWWGGGERHVSGDRSG